METYVKDITDFLEGHFPLWLAASWDNCGLQLGGFNTPVQRAVVTLELDQDIADEAAARQADLVITHHPLFFQPIKNLSADSATGRMVHTLIKAGITVYSLHTNLDAGKNGLNQRLAELMGLERIVPLDRYHQEELCKVAVFVPVSHKDIVQEAMIKAGAGHIGRYSGCTFLSSGTGTFQPELGAQPFVGTIGKLAQVDEIRLETVVYSSDLKHVIASMLAAHPYEEVAYDVYRLANQGRIYSMGRKGSLAQPLRLDALAQLVKERLGCPAVRVVGNPDRMASKIAIISGSGGSMLEAIQPDAVDVVITGDIKYHEAKTADLRGMAVIDAGHQDLEVHMIALLSDLLTAECRQRALDIDILALYPKPCFRHL